MNLDKFASAEQLEKSYLDLEKEFTKKCQELAKLKREMQEKEGSIDENKAVVDEEKVEEVMPEIIKESGEEVEQIPLKTLEEVAEEKKLEKFQVEEGVKENEVKKEETFPQFDLSLRLKASEFLRKNEDAKHLGKEMAKILLKDKKLLSLDDPFKVAYALALQNKRANEGENKKFEENLKVEKVEEVKDDKPVVKILGKNMLGVSPQRKTPRFSSIEEAGREILKSLL